MRRTKLQPPGGETIYAGRTTQDLWTTKASACDRLCVAVATPHWGRSSQQPPYPNGRGAGAANATIYAPQTPIVPFATSYALPTTSYALLEAGQPVAPPFHAVQPLPARLE